MPRRVIGRGALAAVPDSAPEELAADLQAVRDAARTWKIATVEVARTFLAAHENGHTVREIADAAEIGHATVGRVLQAIKIVLVSNGDTEIDQKALDAAMQAVRHPEIRKRRDGKHQVIHLKKRAGKALSSRPRRCLSAKQFRKCWTSLSAMR